MIRLSLTHYPRILELAFKIKWHEINSNLVACYCPKERELMNEMARLIDEVKQSRK